MLAARMLVLVLMTSCTTAGDLVLVLTSTGVDLLHQIFSTTCCIFTLLSLLHQPAIVLLYPRLKIRLPVLSGLQS